MRGGKWLRCFLVSVSVLGGLAWSLGPGATRARALVWLHNAKGQMIDCNGGDPGGEIQYPNNTLWSQDEIRGVDPCGTPNRVLEPSNWNGPNYPNNGPNGDFDVVLGAPANTTLDVIVTIDTLTVQSDGHLDMLGGTQLTIEASSLMNDSQIVVNSDGGSALALLGLFSPTNTGLISGSGEIVLNEGWTGQSPGAWFAAGGSLTTQEAGHTIRGKGLLMAHLTNNGVVEADDTSGGGDPLLKLSVVDQTNNNILRAKLGATLRLEEITITQNPTTGRLIGEGDKDPDPNPQQLGNVELGFDTHIIGGRLEGDIDITDGEVTLENVVNESFKLDSIPGTTTHLRGPNFTNNGLFSVTSPAFNQFTDLHFDDSLSLTGTGELSLGQFTGVRVTAAAGVTVTNDTNHTISGQGRWSVPLVNNGSVEGSDLRFENTTIENNSTMTTLPLGGFSVINTTITQDPNTGILLSGMDGGVNLASSTVINGVLEDTPTSTLFSGFVASNARLIDVHNKARINILFGTTFRVEGSVFTNNGPITVNNDAVSSFTAIEFQDSVSLEGSGEIRLNRVGDGSLLRVIGGGEITHAAAHTIFGFGNLQAKKLTNHGEITGLGVVTAEVNNTATMTNIGEINGDARNVGTLGGRSNRNLQMNGDLTGDGELQFIQINHQHHPGLSVAQVQVAGEYVMGSAGTLHIELGGTTPGTEHDLMDVIVSSGPQARALAELDGALVVELVDAGSGAFVPTTGDSFTILKAPIAGIDTVTGAFTSLDLPSAAGGRGLVWDVIYSGHDVVLEVVATLTGDYNGDGVVNLADYTVWRDALGSMSDLAADGDGSGTVDAGDYAVWKNQFGQTVPPSPIESASVPEPGARVLLLTMLVGYKLRCTFTN